MCFSPQKLNSDAKNLSFVGFCFFFLTSSHPSPHANNKLYFDCQQNKSERPNCPDNQVTSSVCQLQLSGVLCKRRERSILGSELCSLWPGQLRQPSSCCLASAPTLLCSMEEKDRKSQSFEFKLLCGAQPTCTVHCVLVESLGDTHGAVSPLWVLMVLVLLKVSSCHCAEPLITFNVTLFI